MAIMEPGVYRETYRLESRYWWHVNRRRLVEQEIKKVFGGKQKIKILVAGCGTGILMSDLQKFYSNVFGVDDSPLALQFCRKRGLRSVRRGNLEKRLPYPSDSFDVITCLDVIEHLDQDSRALAELHRILRPGGYIFLTVPAYQFLWTNHDEILWHKRRYRRGPLSTLIRSVGFEIVKSSYFYSFLIPPAVILFKLKLIFHHGRAKTTVIPPWPINLLLSLACNIERKIIEFMSLPTGISIFVAAIKK